MPRLRQRDFLNVGERVYGFCREHGVRWLAAEGVIPFERGRWADNEDALRPLADAVFFEFLVRDPYETAR
jgi:hypothetical protein